MSLKCIILFALTISFLQLDAQEVRHLDYLGAGHTNNVIVSASSSRDKSPDSTIDGFDINNPDQLNHASRFLAHASFGADIATINHTAAMGYDAWFEEQFDLPAISYLNEMQIQNGVGGIGYGYGPTNPLTHRLFGTAWLTNTLTSPDLLRQRMTFNLSQIFVVNSNSDVFKKAGESVGHYYDLLQMNSFENYTNVLTDVTYSASMADFLTYYNNPQEDLAINIHPDENYAREIMQLFSIGLWELNPDGSFKTDNSGSFIPTYDNNDIKEFAKVFTGLGDGNPDGEFGTLLAETKDRFVTFTTPLKMYEAFHDKNEKNLLNGYKLDSGENGTSDVNNTIDHLSKHPNTAPFISKALIKMYTTSNPSSNYIRDVATVFDPSKEGNFKDVLKAILLHPEARACDQTDNYTFGKLREPLVRIMNLWKAFPISTNQYGDYFNYQRCNMSRLGQAPLQAPSVFNFYLPEYAPQGTIGQNYLLAPEFQILNATRAMGYVNDINTRAVEGMNMDDECGFEDFFDAFAYIENLDNYETDYSSIEAFVDDPLALVDRLNILLANGMLTNETKNIISSGIAVLPTKEDRIKMAIYAIMISPDYVILK